MRITWKKVLLAGLAGVLAAGAALAAGELQRRREETAGQIAADRGRLRVMLGSEAVATEQFEISRSGDDWVAKGSTDIGLPDGRTGRVRGELRFAPDGAPRRYEWSSEGEQKSSAVFTFTEGTARMELQMAGEQPFQQDFFFTSPRVAILDNNLYHQYALLAVLYDWSRGGAQSFPVLIPQDLTPGTIVVESAPVVDAGGVRRQMLRVRSADLEIEVYLDDARKLVRLAVPAANVEIVRE
jgi:hypothetical protein